MLLRAHDVVLTTERARLRPMTERDWDILLVWNRDREVLLWADSSDEPKTLDEVQGIYRGVSQAAHVFMIEAGGLPIGECWLQRMNLPRILELHPDEDVRRIDIMIGEMDVWNRGYGTEAIRALVAFGFEDQSCDRIYAVGIDPENVRSLRAFSKAGFVLAREVRAAQDVAHGFDLEIESAR